MKNPNKSDFQPSDGRRFAPEARRIIATARMLGWTVRWGGTNKQMVAMHNPDHTHVINVPVTNVNHNRARSWMAQLVRYTPRSNITAVLKDGGPDLRTDPDMAEAAALLGAALVTYADREIERETMTTAETPAPRTVVSQVPRMAKRSGKGKTAESPGVLVRTWSDGTVDYLCRVCEQFANDAMHSVVMHANKRHFATQPRGEGRDKTYATIKVARVGKPSTPVEKSVEQPAAVPPPVPLAEALDAFVALAPRMREIAESIRQLEADRDAALARAEAAEGDLNALRDLLNVGRSA